jgi:hypothetical protein
MEISHSAQHEMVISPVVQVEQQYMPVRQPAPSIAQKQWGFVEEQPV